MLASQADQRSARRFPLQVPLTVKYAEGTLAADALTRDVSLRGICFYMDTNLEVGSSIEIGMVLPAEITMTEPIRVRCKGKVVRVEHTDSLAKVAIAAQIDQYEFLAEQ